MKIRARDLCVFEEDGKTTLGVFNPKNLKVKNITTEKDYFIQDLRKNNRLVTAYALAFAFVLKDNEIYDTDSIKFKILAAKFRKAYKEWKLSIKKRDKEKQQLEKDINF